MQAPPAFSVFVRRFGAWRAGGMALTAAALSACAAWAWSWQSVTAFAWAPLPLVMLATWWALRPVRPFRLRWDTRCWHLDGVPGQLAVALDAGQGLLLRFVPEGRGSVRWLPVQRRGHEAAWHALRCTVYCARPPAPSLVADL